MNLQGTNFQSWANFELDINGLTVIVGRSSKGKSALFRAIRGLFRNELASEYIRQGTEELQLTAVADGKTVTGIRSTKGTKYQIGDKKFAKLGGNIPEEASGFRYEPNQDWGIHI